MPKLFDGSKCAKCGIFFGAIKSPDYPHYCEQCKVTRHKELFQMRQKGKVACSICGKKVWSYGRGMENHLLMAHQVVAEEKSAC